ncbi:MAG: NAD(P)-binding protein [Chromatiales bacterium]|jgi:monoamine oxidase|nr:NAD(P)-binding protein [Chromatiales bacterium]
MVYKVPVLGARERLGGRLESVLVPGGHADLGATWFRPGEQHVIDLAQNTGLAVHRQ